MAKEIEANRSHLRWEKGDRALLVREIHATAGGIGYPDDAFVDYLQFSDGNRVYAVCVSTKFGPRYRWLPLSCGVVTGPYDVPFPVETIRVGNFKLAAGKAQPIAPTAFRSLRAGTIYPDSNQGEGPLVFPTGPKMWRIPISIEAENEAAIGASFQALDRHDRVVAVVDREGRPVSSSTPVAPEAARDGQIDPSAPAFRATFATHEGRWFSPVRWCVTNIRPGAIRKLRVSPYRWTEFKVGPFPLEPIRGSTSP